MEPALRESYTMHDLLARAEEYRQRAGTARTADIQLALLRLAQLYEETVDQRQQSAECERMPAELT